MLIEEMVRFANKARKEGIVSLDSDLESISDPFLKKALMLAVDGTEPEELRKMMELELDNQAEHDENIPKVFEAAGGFAPTIGIIGAVLGLIQVMQHLDNIAEVGRGIAVAFVATIYGVGSANLLFLPAAGKLKLRIREGQVQKEMMLEGVISILEGMNPRMLEAKLQGFLAESDHEKKCRDEPRVGSAGSEEHANHERWLISYADFITLLFAFFVVLFSSAQVDHRKVGQIAMAIQVAFQQMGVFETSNTHMPLDKSEPMPFEKVQVIENACAIPISRKWSRR